MYFNAKCLYFLQGNLSEIHGKSNHDSWHTILDLLVRTDQLPKETIFLLEAAWLNEIPCPGGRCFFFLAQPNERLSIVGHLDTSATNQHNKETARAVGRVKKVKR